MITLWLKYEQQLSLYVWIVRRAASNNFIYKNKKNKRKERVGNREIQREFKGNREKEDKESKSKNYVDISIEVKFKSLFIFLIFFNFKSY